MKRARLLITFGNISIILAILTSAFFVVPAHTAGTTVSVDAASIITDVGQNFNFNITISNVINLYGWEFGLSWDASLLDVVNVAEGSFLNGGGAHQTFFSYNITSANGQLIVDCTLLGLVPGINGNGVLSTMTLFAKNAGQSPLHLYNVSLIDANENTIPCETADGNWQANPPHDVGITQVGVYPTIVLPGNPVDINVTVQNEGSYAEVFNVTVNANSATIDTRQVSLDSGNSTVVRFTWDTTGKAKGDYVILASASPVLGETHLADNNKTSDNPVTILTQGHDVAVVSVKPTRNVVGQGYNVTIEVKVGDYGTYSETFNVTVYLNTTVIGTQTVFLTSGGKSVLLFTRTSSNLVKSNYTVSSTAGPVPGETQTGDNTLNGGLILITIPGDINGDLAVNIFDAIMLASGFNSKSTSINWYPNADINGDNVVDIFDAIILALNEGKSSI